MGREFEMKYRADARQQAAIRAQFGPWRTMTMETTYYYTPGGSLSARKITLRKRMENGKAVCTVKTPAHGGGRGEWETECDDIEAAIPVLCKLGCPEEILLLTRDGVAPVCGARFTRQFTAVVQSGMELELALDEGVLLGGGREIPLCEVEIEAKPSCDADQDATEAAAKAWGDRFQQEFGLQPEGKSKFSRANALAKGE